MFRRILTASHSKNSSRGDVDRLEFEGMNLDYSSLAHAVQRLKKGIARAEAAPGDEELRDAVIQRFEYTFELSWKMLKRRLEANAAVPGDVDRMSFRELMREGAERGWIQDPEQWMYFRDQRNLTSHVYDAEKAAEVYETAKAFVPHADQLLAELTKRG